MRAVLFDAAGTLIELAEPVGETYVQSARAYGGEGGDAACVDAAFREVLRGMPPMLFPDRGAEKTKELEREWWRRVVGATFAASGVRIDDARLEQCFDDLFQHYARSQAWRLAPGALEVIAELRRRGLRTGVVSNFDHRLPRILDGLGIAALLDVVVLPSDAGAVKPQPGIFRFALARLAVEASQALYVGDDAVDDIGGATAAGLAAVDVATLADWRALLARAEVDR